jgi:hypothetical protein
MILGMSLATFTMVHAIISLIAIAAGILTSASGFLFPPLLFEKLSPGHVIGILSLVLLAIACLALYGMKLAGAWRWIYALTALISLYLNVFVLVIQSFLKVPALHALAPSVPLAEPPFAIVQSVVLLSFAVVIVGVIRRYRPVPA